MVHALEEIWRVLIQDGFLIDLRPFGEKSSVEVVSGDEVIPTGYIDSSAGFPDDLAANTAIEHMVGSGMLNREKRDSFDLFTYWDTAAEFKAFMDEHSSSILPSETLIQAEHLLAQHGSDARLRTRHDMIISRYHKTTMT